MRTTFWFGSLQERDNSGRHRQKWENNEIIDFKDIGRKNVR